MDLQSPSILAQLPRPLHATTGKTRIGDVFSLADSKKRKRYEVAVAVDGEAVNIYNVRLKAFKFSSLLFMSNFFSDSKQIQTPKLVTSYAVPPQSKFSCRPCSVRRKLKTTVKRQTFAAAIKPEQQIKSFVEEISSGSSAPTISSSTTTIKDSRSPVAFLGIVPFSIKDGVESDPFDIIAVHEDGHVRRLSSDLKTQRWSIQHSEISKVSSTHAVHTCFLIDLEDARKGLFKRRQDLVALALAGSNVGEDEPSVLLVLSLPTNAGHIALEDVNVQIFSVPAKSINSSEESQRLQHLQTVTVPSVDGLQKVSAETLQWNFHSGSAGLQLSFDKGFINIDLSQYSPSVTSQFILDDKFSSVMRISPQCVIGASESLVAVYDTQYQSIQRSIATSDVLSSSGLNTDRPTVFITYFAKLGIAVATKGNTLIAFDLTSLHTPSAPSLKRSRDGLLIDAIGRGIGSSAAQWDMSSKKRQAENKASLQLDSTEKIEKWNVFTKGVEEATNARDTTKFDNALLAFFEVETPAALPTEFINSEYSLFILSKIFAIENVASSDAATASSQSQLRVVLWPKATCKWLLRLGHFTLDNIQVALRRVNKPQVLQPLPTGSFVQALVDSDPSLGHINEVIRHSSILASSDELSFALKHFLKQVHSYFSTLQETARAISNNDAATPTEELTRRLGSEKTIVEAIFKGLNTSLNKLHSHPIPSIIKSLRSNLSRSELLFMIDHLRLCLATGGFTSPFGENPPYAHHPCTNQTYRFSQDDHSGALNDASREAELITDLKSEVSAALGGIEESLYLKGILRELLSFTEATQAMKKHASSKSERDTTPNPSNSVRYEKLNGADLMIFTQPEDGDGFDADASGKMLPLSMKPASKNVSKTKVKKSTGETKARTSREIGYLNRKAAGKYSFERLLI
ncbi:hypothetical protein N7468_003748 [Penicillium chermesinum]|uniref:Uncharacterized protein n=1 Tax=Penicillium chermesinum TaxID=63820 RepID=A0A9W9P7A1_9EURO|nr:uncharacterized protein N7468_003748 [Penicillium chermesinum]KAJ5239129.1 hypothetical protein N7468_003748 [Penicillium chermesinum]